MYCPKCRKPLFETDKCRYCDWVKVEIQPASNITGMFCNQCGALIPRNSVFCPKCGANQITQDQQTEEKTSSFPIYYHILSWFTVALLLLIGISQFSSNNDTASYKAIIKCLAALIFIPQISAGNKEKPLVLYAFKWIIAIFVMIFI